MQQPSSPSVVSAYASTIAAQAKSDLVRLEIVSVDADGAVQNLPVSGVPVISDTGAVVAYETTAAAPGNASSSVDDRQVWIRDRDGRTSRALAEPGSTAPGISGDGCVVAYSVIVADEIRLTVIDRCATAIELQLPKAPSPLPNGLVLDAFTLEPPASAVDPGAIRVGAPALSFDGSTIAWGRRVEMSGATTVRLQAARMSSPTPSTPARTVHPPSRPAIRSTSPPMATRSSSSLDRAPHPSSQSPPTSTSGRPWNWNR